MVRDIIESALRRAARNRADYAGIGDSEHDTIVHGAFMSGVNEPRLEWHHRKRPA
ncbi:MAG: hypothetical protein GY789_26365 [Hyphomicrobiales bacterium]|nr:hypothetical protein [Hyphomicrobiales bacterium]